jgi:hypothetical protein
MPVTHRERLETILSGGKPDRPAIALWSHFPVDDQNPINLAKATLAFQERYDFDLVKVMPASSFCLKDWGAQDKWQGNTEGTRDYTHRIIHQPEDWAKLPISLIRIKATLVNNCSVFPCFKTHFQTIRLFSKQSSTHFPRQKIWLGRSN